MAPPRVIAHCATIHDRLHTLIQMVESLKPQVDEIRVYLNNYPRVPTDEAFDDKVTLFQRPAGDLGDRGKFYLHEPDAINLTVDDDLLYGEEYVNIIVGGLVKYPGAIITLHGRKFRRPISSYYRDHRGQAQYHCLRKVTYDHRVDVPGTGVMVYTGRQIFSYHYLDYPNMADILVGIEAKNRGKKVICIQHEEGLVVQLPVKKTIFVNKLFDDEHHTALVNAAFSPWT
jgi:hypothetical protein